ncbi:MAG: Ig-like domain-containing protein [Anaerolineae bacterium]
MSRLVTLILVLALAFLSACNLATTPPTAIPTPDLPRVDFEQPANGATVVEGSELTIDLVASDETQGIARIELLVDDLNYRDGTPENEVPVPTFHVLMNWLAQGVGRHVLTAIAYRPDGTRSDERSILIEVLPRETPTP